jgi:hypothetical protein
MPEGDSLGRETRGEVVLVPRMRTALERLNASRTGSPALPSGPSQLPFQCFANFSPAGEMACFSEITVEVADREADMGA